MACHHMNVNALLITYTSSLFFFPYSYVTGHNIRTVKNRIPFRANRFGVNPEWQSSAFFTKCALGLRNMQYYVQYLQHPYILQVIRRTHWPFCILYCVRELLRYLASLACCTRTCLRVPTCLRGISWEFVALPIVDSVVAKRERERKVQQDGKKENGTSLLLFLLLLSYLLHFFLFSLSPYGICVYVCREDQERDFFSASSFFSCLPLPIGMCGQWTRLLHFIHLLRRQLDIQRVSNTQSQMSPPTFFSTISLMEPFI